MFWVTVGFACPSGVSDPQAARCWIVVPRNGPFTYTANARNGTISSTVGEKLDLALLAVATASAAHGSATTDMALSNNGRFLYVRNCGNGTISGFRLNADGSLTPTSTIGGLSVGTQGIAAR